MTRPIAAALALAADHRPVFPCGADKRPLVATGFKAATCDADQILGWWSRWPDALVAVPTGAASGLVVVDGDVIPGADGRALLREWTRAGRLPVTRTHETRRGGVHLLFRDNPDHALKCSAGKVAPAIDTRGTGGYAIWWPAHAGRVLRATELAELPRWVCEAVDPPRPAPASTPRRRCVDHGGSAYGLAALDAETQAVMAAGFGQQERTLNLAALRIGALVAGGELQPNVARAALIAAGQHMACQPGREPWAAAEIERKVTRGMADGARRPRSRPPTFSKRAAA